MATGLPIVGAEIHGSPAQLSELARGKTITTASGQFTVDQVTPGAQEIWAVKDGYLPDFVTATIQAGNSSTMNISLRPAGRISGQVMRDGVAVSGQLLLLIDSDGNMIPIQADAAGHFVFKDLPDGTYSLYVGSDPRIAAPYQQFTLSPSGNRYDLTIPLYYSVLSGTVYAPGASTPAANALVELEQAGRVIATALTDSTGQYQFTLFQGGTFDVFSALGDGIAASRNIQIALNEDCTGQNLTCDSSSIQLTVGSSAAGLARLADALVTLIPAGLMAESSVQLAATTDQNGQVQFAHVRPAPTER